MPWVRPVWTSVAAAVCATPACAFTWPALRVVVSASAHASARNPDTSAVRVLPPALRIGRSLA
jgi:hypothetical protein